MAFWPTNKSEVFCPCLNDIINYEDHFYLKTVSSVQYHKGPTSNTCVVTYRWGSYNSTGSSVEEYEERDSGALLRREFISRNSASLIGLCKNTHANMSIPLTPQIQLKTQSKWYYSIRKFCKFDQYPWKDYGTYDKKLTFVFNPSARSQGIGQGLIGLSFAMYLSLQSHRRLQLDWRQGVLFLEDWSTATSNWNPSHSHKTPQPIWNFGQTESASKMVQLLLSDEAEVVISGNSIKEKLPEFRKLFAHNIWESDDEAIRICRACAFPFLFDDDVDVNYENVLHLRLGDNVAYGFGSDRRKIMKLAHTIENAVDRGVKLLGSGDIFVESDSTRAKSYASKTYSNVQTKPSVGHTGTSSATLQDMKEMWQVILRMAAAKNVLYTQSALSEASVALGAAVLTNAMRFEDKFDTKTLTSAKREPVQLTMKQATCDIQRFTKEAVNLWWIGNEQGKQWNPEWLDNSKKFAYVWWTSISEYTWSALVAIKSLKSTNPSEQIDFVLIHTIALSEKQKQLLDAFGVKCISFENAESVQNSYYKYANNKLYIFKLTQYAKLIFMDSDSMPLKNLDHMFLFPDAPVVAPCPYWEPEQQPKFVSWFMLVMPNENSFNMLIKRASDMPSQPDMETFNDVFKKDMILLPSYYGLLNSEWENDGNIAFHNHDKDIYTKTPIVHYTIKGKPWQHAKDFFKGKVWDIEANLLHNRWWDLRESLNTPQIDKLPPCFELLKPDSVFVKTGDILDMWIRDSTAQVWPYRDASPVVEKVLNMQSFFILQDPYANSYRNHEVVSPTRADLKLGREGWVATRNYELDSGCYFIRLLHYAWQYHDLSVQRYRPTVETLVNTWKTEQYHEEQSPYRYVELPRNGLGTPVKYTGMTWSGFRPSDDACQYGYHIPSNFFAAEALASMLEMFPAMEGAAELRSDILNGIQTHGVWKDSNGVERYCYEVDGLGNCNKMDDANVPSLLSIPYLSPRPVNRAIWKNTYDWIWSSKNPYFFEGKVAEGIGSPHTPHNYIWPMSMIIRGLVDPAKCQVMKALVEKTMTRNTIHESFDKDNAQRLTREDFAWPNALYEEMDCKPSVSIGIPAIWDDKNVILDAIKSAEQQTVLPKEIVIVMSGVPANEHPKFDSSLPMRIFTENTLRYAGWARNKIASLASGEWIAYIDADDIMHRKRVETFYALYTSKDILVLHSHATNEKTIDVAKRQIISGDQLLESALKTGNTMPLLPDGVHNIHHGHPIVKKTLFDSIKYDEGLRRGQDTEFLHRAIQYLKGQGVKYIHAPLSIYVNTREAKSLAKVKDVHTVRNEVINSKNIL